MSWFGWRRANSAGGDGGIRQSGGDAVNWFGRRPALQADERTVTLRVRRTDPARWQEYRVTARPKMSVLDALFDALETQDPTLSFRYSCRAQMCGSCAMVIDGREALACGRRLEQLGETLTIEPLRNMPVLKDLVVDLAPFFGQYAAVEPNFHGHQREPAVLRPAAGLRDQIEGQLGCISCGACYSACPIVGLNRQYRGPAALNRAYTLVADIRDDDAAARLALVAGEDGVFSCRGVGSCVEVCPVGVQPLLAIQLLRRRAARA